MVAGTFREVLVAKKQLRYFEMLVAPVRRLGLTILMMAVASDVLLCSVYGYKHYTPSCTDPSLKSLDIKWKNVGPDKFLITFDQEMKNDNKFDHLKTHNVRFKDKPDGWGGHSWADRDVINFEPNQEVTLKLRNCRWVEFHQHAIQKQHSVWINGQGVIECKNKDSEPKCYYTGTQ